MLVSRVARIECEGVIGGIVDDTSRKRAGHVDDGQHGSIVDIGCIGKRIQHAGSAVFHNIDVCNRTTDRWRIVGAGNNHSHRLRGGRIGRRSAVVFHRDCVAHGDRLAIREILDQAVVEVEIPGDRAGIRGESPRLQGQRMLQCCR